MGHTTAQGKLAPLSPPTHIDRPIHLDLKWTDAELLNSILTDYLLRYPSSVAKEIQDELVRAILANMGRA
jgi:hypothetical protein